MRRLIIIMLLIGAQRAVAQNAPLVFSNFGPPIIVGVDTFRSSKIHQIILHTDSTFEFWSRPHISCFTWHSYKGTWKKENDTLLFYDSYEVEEQDTRIAYNKDTTKRFRIHFKTDKNSPLANRKTKVVFMYNFDDKLDDIENVFHIGKHNTLSIPFNVIPYYNQLATIKIVYQLNATEKRVSYLTENNTISVKKGDLPNIINVVFVERPKKEIVYRVTKAITQNNRIVIISTIKTNATLPDYYKTLEFENDYSLNK